MRQRPAHIVILRHHICKKQSLCGAKWPAGAHDGSGMGYETEPIVDGRLNMCLPYQATKVAEAWLSSNANTVKLTPYTFGAGNAGANVWQQCRPRSSRPLIFPLAVAMLAKAAALASWESAVLHRPAHTLLAAMAAKARVPDIHIIIASQAE